MMTNWADVVVWLSVSWIYVRVEEFQAGFCIVARVIAFVCTLLFREMFTVCFQQANQLTFINGGNKITVMTFYICGNLISQ